MCKGFNNKTEGRSPKRKLSENVPSAKYCESEEVKIDKMGGKWCARGSDKN